MVRILGLLTAVASAFILTACAADHEDDPNRVSTIPWNRPEKWEGTGQLGSMMSQ